MVLNGQKLQFSSLPYCLQFIQTQRTLNNGDLQVEVRELVARRHLGGLNRPLLDDLPMDKTSQSLLRYGTLLSACRDRSRKHKLL